MINFACKKFDMNEVFRCSLNLTKTEYALLLFLIKNPKYMSSRTIAETLNLDLTTAQRAMKKLFLLNVVDRMQENLENGGYIFRYKIKGNEVIQKKIEEIIDNWTKNIKRELYNWKS